MALKFNPFANLYRVSRSAGEQLAAWAAGARARAESALAANREEFWAPVEKIVAVEVALDDQDDYNNTLATLVWLGLFNARMGKEEADRARQVRQANRDKKSRRLANLVRVLDQARNLLDKVVDITEEWDNLLLAGKVVDSAAHNVVIAERRLLDVGAWGALSLAFDCGYLF